MHTSSENCSRLNCVITNCKINAIKLLCSLQGRSYPRVGNTCSREGICTLVSLRTSLKGHWNQNFNAMSNGEQPRPSVLDLFNIFYPLLKIPQFEKNGDKVGRMPVQPRFTKWSVKTSQLRVLQSTHIARFSPRF